MTNIFNIYDYDRKYFSNTSNYNRVGKLKYQEKEKLFNMIDALFDNLCEYEYYDKLACDVISSNYLIDTPEGKSIISRRDFANAQYESNFNATVEYLKVLDSRYIFNPREDHYESGDIYTTLNDMSRDASLPKHLYWSKHNMIARLISEAGLGRY
jgi:hypothetical protein